MATINKFNIDKIKNLLFKYIPCDSSVLLKQNESSECIQALVFIFDFRTEKKLQITDEEIHIEIHFISIEILYDAFLQFDAYFAYFISDCIVIHDPSAMFHKVQKMVEPLLSKYAENVWNITLPQTFISYYTLCRICNRFDSSIILSLLRQYISICLNSHSHMSYFEIEQHNLDLIKRIFSCCVDYPKSKTEIFKLFDEAYEQILASTVKNNKIDIFFEGGYTLSDFINAVYLPLSKKLSAFLFNSGFSIQRINNDDPVKKHGVLLSYYFKDTDNKQQARIKLKSVLFKSVSEMKLSKIHFPISFAESYDNRSSEALEHIKQKLCSDFVYQNSINALSEDRIFALVLYYYISIGYHYYETRDEFYRSNIVIYEHLIADSGKYFPTAPLSCVSFFEIREKIEKEYAKSYCNMKNQVEADYKNLLQDNNTTIIAEYGNLIANLKNSISQNTEINRLGKNLNSKDSTFLAFTQNLFSLGFIEDYYKAFVPFIVKELYYDEI